MPSRVSVAVEITSQQHPYALRTKHRCLNVVTKLGLVTGVTIRRNAGRKVPPDGIALVTVTQAEPALAMSVAGTLVVSREAFTNLVVRVIPFQ
jgi:hypothetical protein